MVWNASQNKRLTNKRRPKKNYFILSCTLCTLLRSSSNGRYLRLIASDYPLIVITLLNVGLKEGKKKMNVIVILIGPLVLHSNKQKK